MIKFSNNSCITKMLIDKVQTQIRLLLLIRNFTVCYFNKHLVNQRIGFLRFGRKKSKKICLNFGAFTITELFPLVTIILVSLACSNNNNKDILTCCPASQE